MDERVRAALGALGIGLLVGTVAGLVDQLLRVVDPNAGVAPSALLAVCVMYAVPFALLGAGLGAATGRGRNAVASLVPLALVAVLGGWVNVRWLPALTAPISLVFDVVAVGLGVLLAWWLGRRLPARLPAARAAALAIVLLIGAAAVSWTGRGGDGTVERGEAGPGAPNVLVFLLDALRADHVGVYGYERDTTPNLDRLAREGLRFDRAYAPSSWTKPTVASLFTGLLPASHGNHRIASRLPGEAPSLPTMLRARGYRTAVFAENTFVSRLFGYDRGVDHFVGLDPDVPAQTVLGHVLQQLAVRAAVFEPALAAARTVNPLDPRQAGRRGGSLDVPAAVSDWVDRVPDDRPWFAYVHLLKPHAPYIAPEPFDGFFGEPDAPDSPVDPPHVEGVAPFASAPEAGDETWRRRLIANYDERLRYGDHLVGEMLEKVRSRSWDRDLVVLVVSDHGEEFGENGLYDHGHSLQEGVVRVPLIMHGIRGVTPGTVVEQRVRLLDLPPTVMQLAGEAATLPLQGRSLLEFLDPASASSEDREIVLEVEHGADYWSRGLVTQDFKYLHTRQSGREARLVFDLRLDPTERAPRAADATEQATWMAEALDRARAEGPGFAEAGGEATLDPATEERLRALGYIQ